MVLSKAGGERAEIGFADGSTGIAPRVGGAASPSAAAAARPSAICKPGMIIIVKQLGAEQLCAALDPRDRRRLRRRGSPHRPRAGDAGRLRRHRLVLQPRDPGAAPAGLGVQADRLCDRARKRHDPGLDHRRCAVLRVAGRGPRQQMLPQLRRQLFRAQDDALGRRAVAQPDDRPRRLADRHGQGRRQRRQARRRRL